MPYEGMHSAQFMGLINALRTGDPTVDMLAAFMLPFLMQKAIHEVPRGVQCLLRRLFGKKKIPIRKYRRNIVHRTTQSTTNGVRMSTDEDSFNMYLLRAIQLYVHHHCQLKELDDAHLDLTLLDTSRCQQNRSNGRMTMQNRNGNQSTNSTVEMLQMCSVVEKQMENSWLNVGKHGGGEVNIMICDSTVAQQGKKQSGGSSDGGEEGGGGNKSETRSLEIKLESSHSVESISAFVTTAFDWYVNEIKKMENRDRYMLDVQPMGPRNGCNPQYTAYKLSEEKTFDTLFNRKCHELLRVVDHFERKTGKYAIKGYPHKLGLLLTGIPGTGKTSLIKALAHRTGRHIVNVNLSHIATNGDLRKIFFNKMYQITGVNSHFMRLDFDQVIFVLEDVDAGAKEVVMDRALLAAEEEHAKASLASSPTKPQNDPQAPATTVLGITRANRFSVLSGVDKLNLSGLLNVLDGVVESPGRIVIMTSNHPEILDPALIRPGRIDKILELGYLEVEDILAMLGHYFPERKMSEEERARVTKCILEDDVKITPAQVEQLAMEEETLSGFLERLCVFGKEDEKKRGDRLYANFVIRSPGETKKSSRTLASEVVSSGTVASDATESSTAEEKEYQLLLDVLEEEDYGDY